MIEDLLNRSALQAEVADRRVEALRLAATVGGAREFHEREVQRGLDRYEKALADLAGAEPAVATEGDAEVGANPPSG